MTTNVGNADRVIRIIIPAAIILLSIFKIITGTVDLILLIVAFILVVTGIIGICPLYRLLGINTCRKKTSQ